MLENQSKRGTDEYVHTWCISDNPLFDEPFYKAEEVGQDRKHIIQCIDDQTSDSLLSSLGNRGLFRKKEKTVRKPNVVLIDVTPDEKLSSRFETLIKYKDSHIDELHIGVLSRGKPDGLVYDCYRLGVQCFIDTESGDIDDVLRAIALISRGKHLFPVDADRMMRNVIRALNSDHMFKVNNMCLKMLHLCVEGYTEEAIMRVLDVDRAAMEKLLSDVKQFSGSTDRKALVKCALVAGMQPDTEACNSGFIH